MRRRFVLELLIQLKRSARARLAFLGLAAGHGTWHLKKHPVHYRLDDRSASGALARLGLVWI